MQAPMTAVPGTGMAGAGGIGTGKWAAQRIPEGQLTSTVYQMIADQKYQQVLQVLDHSLSSFPKSRPALSLCAYCHYMMQAYPQAAAMYERLVSLFPEQDEYKVSLAQALYKAGQYTEAHRAALTVDNEAYQQRLLKLMAMIKYELEDYSGTRALLEQCLGDDPELTVIRACVAYTEQQHDKAHGLFAQAISQIGQTPDLQYNLALCQYRLSRFGPALKTIAEVIETGIREHPELSVGTNSDGVDVKSVGNTQTLKETALVETFNLKAAIEWNMKNVENAREALSDMPPRGEEELDAVTLHNQALMSMDDNPANGFAKLNFLLQQNPCPPETFGNLLLLYAKHSMFDEAADVLAEHSHLTFKYLSQDMYEFLDALISQQASPDDAYAKFEQLSNKHIDALRKMTKKVQDARMARDAEGVKAGIQDYDTALEQYIPVLMAQAKVHWDRGHYTQVEKLFRQSAEFCSEHDVWKMNVAHVFFMQEGKYKDAIRYYAPLVRAMEDNILEVTPIVLANLCVSYIMTNANEEAEELMKCIEKEEDRVSVEDPSKMTFHSCIINLVIGTLYCAKGNYDFGVSRIIKSLEPYNRKLGTDTWYYVKRALLSLFETMAKHMIMLQDEMMLQILELLEACELHGREIPASMAPVCLDSAEGNDEPDVGQTVAQEARVLKYLLLKVRDAT